MAANTPLLAKRHTAQLAKMLAGNGAKFVSFQDWTKTGVGARPNRAAAPSKIRGVIIHHSTGLAKGDGVRDVRMVERGAAGRKRSDGRPLFSMVPYSFLVPMTGEVFEGRAFSYGNAANKSGKVKKWGNHNTYSICLPGMYHPPANQSPTPQQLLTVRKLIAALEKVAGRGLTVLGHRDMSWTACPGNVLYAEMDNIRKPLSYMDAARKPEPKLELDRQLVKRLLDGDLEYGDALHGSKDERLAAAVALMVTDGSDPLGAATRLDAMTMVARSAYMSRVALERKP